MNSHDMALHEDAANRLVLGTAQLGMPYGIANRSGQPDAFSRASHHRGGLGGWDPNL